MKKSRSIAPLLLVLLLALPLLAQPAEETDRIADLKRAPRIDEVVTIAGHVTQFDSTNPKTTNFYLIKDDFGDVIRVRTSKTLPSVGKRYIIEGPLSIDRRRQLFVSEESREEIFSAVEAKVALTEENRISPPVPATGASIVTPAGSGGSTTTGTTSGTTSGTTTGTTDSTKLIEDKPDVTSFKTYAALGAAVLVILAIAAFMFVKGRRDDDSSADLQSASLIRMDPLPAPEQVLEGKTIKLHAPPPNTVKLMPGWFEVVGGDDVVKQIRFYNVGGEAETTFGRATGRPYTHIQLKAPTVSSRQAKVAFENGSAKLTNFAGSGSNPTLVNGKELGVNESVLLKESDRVEMGEVALLFHDTPAVNFVS